MTQIGKCDTCRARKVKCDEKKPKCSACRKKERACTYTYGKVAALVFEDPEVFSGHGKTRIAPRIVPLVTQPLAQNGPHSDAPEESFSFDDEESNRSGFNSALEPSSSHSSRATSTSPRSPWSLDRSRAIISRAWSPTFQVRPSCAANVLASRYVNMLGSHHGDANPFAIYGSWIGLVPSRIGHNRVLDSAIEFMLNSFANFWDDTYSKQRAAGLSKAVALKELRLAIEEGNGRVNDNVLLATMLHFCAEIYMGLKNIGWVLHVLGLSKMLNQHNIVGADRTLVWSLVDSLYMDEVSESMLDGRPSIYDTQFYLSCTSPKVFAHAGRQVPIFEQASRTIMHLLIQIPRLVCLVRRSISDRDNEDSLASACTLAASLWKISTFPPIQELFESSTITLSVPPSEDIADLVPESICFDSVSNLLLLSRYWRFRIFLCALIQNLHRHFDTGDAMAMLPDVATARSEDVKAALALVRSVQSALSFSPSLQLVPLRILSSLQVSVGTWNRIIKRHLSTAPDHVPYVSDDPFDNLINAQRMQDWVIHYTNHIHTMWHVPQVQAHMFDIVLDVAAGSEIPEWMHRRMEWHDMALDGKELALTYNGNDGWPIPSAKNCYDVGAAVGAPSRSIKF